MDNIKVLISEKELQKRVSSLEKEIENDYEDKEINLICILNDSIFFTTDLAKK